MNIIKRELKANSKTIIFWSIGIIFIVSIWMVEFDSFANNPQMNDLLDSMPQGMLRALGMDDMNLTSVGGFLSTISLYIYLLLGIQSVILGSSIISKEERDKTAEYLFTMPIPREKVIRSKLIASIIILVILNIITLVTTIIGSLRYEKDDKFYKFLAMLFVSVFIFQMIFLSVGMLVSSINKRYKKSGNISVSILVITFLIASLINMVDSVDYLKYITPFKYFDGARLLKSFKIEPKFLIISLLIIIIGIIGTFIFYPKRDLHI